MLEPSRGLTPPQLDAIADLERRVVAADGGRLKLEWGTLRSRPGDQVSDFLWWDGARLLGFAGIYRFGGSVEVAGMVDPAARGQGIGTALLDAVLTETKEPLLVVPRASEAGKRLALRRGGVLDHSEYALELRGEPTPGPTDPRITVRPAVAADVPVQAKLLADAFGDLDLDLAERLQGAWIIERSGTPVGTIRIDEDDDDRVGVYGFAVSPEHQGQGIGRQVLREVCRKALAGGASKVALEVAVDNPNALGLYTSLGFVPVLTEDYYRVP